ncbi:MAG: sulfite exporter TauE/SafE family protein [Thermoanaerobaculia bacterium]
MALALGLLFSAGIGMSLGLIGGGGSIITVPVLVYVLGVPPYRAIGMSLAVVGSTAAVSALLHHRRGAVAWKTGAVFAASGIASAYLGSRLTHRVAPQVLLLIFAGLMLVVASVMLTRKDPDPAAPPRRLSVPRSILAGLGVGFLTGFLGVGGGFLIVPALVLFGGLTMREAIGTSLFVIAVNCAAGLAGHASQEPQDWRLTSAVAAVAVAGALGGTALSHGTHPAGLRRAFAWFVVAVALFLIARNYNALL